MSGPSKGAIRAGKALADMMGAASVAAMEASRHGLQVHEVYDEAVRQLAQTIDEHTGAARLAEALRDLLEATTDGLDDYDATEHAVESARAALRSWEER